MSSSLDKSQSERDRKGTSRFCSTPVVNNPRKLSISVSAVETNSSSSTKTISRRAVNRKKKRKKPKKKTRQLRKRRLNTHVISTSDWETRSEQSVYDKTLQIEKTVSGIDTNVLFNDVGSPDHIRDAPRIAEYRLESPTLRSTQWQVASPGQIIFGEADTLPLKELPSLNIPLVDTDDEEDQFSLKKENAVKTYLNLKNVRQTKQNASIEKCKQWLIDVSIPTTSSDMRWDSFVENNYEKVSKYLAKSSYTEQKSSTCVHRKRKHDETEENEYNHERKNTEENVRLTLRENMDVVRGYWDKSLQKWVRTHNFDVYNYPQQEDNEFTKDPKTGIRMTMNQFLHKCRSEKEKMERTTANPLYLKTRQGDIKQDSKKTRNEERRSKRLKSGIKQSKTTIEDVSDSETENLQSRLNTTDTSTSTDISLKESITRRATSRLSSPKRANKQDTNDTNIVDKRRKIFVKNKPTIKSVESLTTMQCYKDRGTWIIHNTNRL